MNNDDLEEYPAHTPGDVHGRWGGITSSLNLVVNLKIFSFEVCGNGARLTLEIIDFNNHNSPFPSSEPWKPEMAL